jgi:hypothetical protein
MQQALFLFGVVLVLFMLILLLEKFESLLRTVKAQENSEE